MVWIWRTDSVRAKDINDMFANPNINAIFAVRGGYGGIRIVDKLNYDIIKKIQKLFQDLVIIRHYYWQSMKKQGL